METGDIGSPIWAGIGVVLVVRFGSFGFGRRGPLPFQETLSGTGVVSVFGSDTLARFVGGNGIHKLSEN